MTPYLPWLVILCGGITTSKHVFSHMSNTVNDAGIKGPLKPEAAGPSTSKDKAKYRSTKVQKDASKHLTRPIQFYLSAMPTDRVINRHKLAPPYVQRTPPATR